MTKRLTVVLASFAMLVGCAADISPASYSVGAVGQVNRTVAAKVVSVRYVDVRGTSDVGSMAGAGIGAAAGSSVGGSTQANIAGAIGGAVLGALAGGAMERSATDQKGMEYVVETSNGNLMTIVQGTELVLPVGARVLVLYGSPARLIADPRAS